MKIRMSNCQENCYSMGSQLSPIIIKTLICFYLQEIMTVWVLFLLKSTDNLRWIFETLCTLQEVYWLNKFDTLQLTVLRIALLMQADDVKFYSNNST